MNFQKSKDIVYTNENCVGCNRCIAECPILGASIAVIKNGKNRVEVNSAKCIGCGYCLNICKHNAREYKDDVKDFFHDLISGEKISLIVSPTFYLNYPKKAGKILSYLKSMGVKNIFNESYGVEIATWCYLKYMEENPKSSFLTQTCTAIVSGITKANPSLLEHLIPIHSPLMCLAIYLRKYQGYSDKIAYLSPCIAKKMEIDSPDTDNLVQYNVTFKHLFNNISDEVIEKFDNVIPDIDDIGMGACYPFISGIKDNLTPYLKNEELIFTFNDVINNYKYDRKYECLLKNPETQILIDSLHCENGCLHGTGVKKDSINLTDSVNYYKSLKCKFRKYKTPEENKKVIYEKFSDLEFEDFKRIYTDVYQQNFEVPESVIEEIFLSMYKETPESRSVNCRACGYSSCRKMAKAIALGYNDRRNCARYERDENNLLYTRDLISGLPNRLAFVKALEEILQEKKNKHYAVVQFNIKNFTLINSRLGFEGANEIIREYVKEVLSSLGGEERVFHSSGDSFFAIVPRESVVSFLYILNNVELNRLKINREEEMDLRIRAGVYELDDSETSIHQIIERVAAAYLITRSHKNQDIAFFDKEMSDRIISTLRLSRYVVKSIENKELFVVFQPKVSVKDKKLVGAEALVRWEKDGKSYPPNEFIPICETNGYVRRIDFFMLNTVCEHLKNWINRGIEPVKISVNFSKLHFEKDDVAQRILHIINKWEIPHNLIEIEFTETTYTDKEDKLKSTLDFLHKGMISTSIDDFGSGYSSLSLLQNLDFDIVKLDKSLIDTIMIKEKSLKVVKNIIKMGKDLDMSILAEGVETKEEYEILKSLDCDYIQGYLFDKPLSIKDFEQRLIDKQYYI